MDRHLVRTGVWGLLIVSLTAHPVQASEAGAPSKAKVRPTEPKAAQAPARAGSTLPLKASVSLVQNLGMGTFSEGAGELSRPYYNMLLTAQGAYRLPSPLKLVLGLRVELDVNVVENFDSTGTRPSKSTLVIFDCLPMQKIFSGTPAATSRFLVGCTFSYQLH